MNKSLLKVGLASLLLVALVVGLYGQFLWNPLIFDDLPFFMEDGQGVQPVSNYHFALLELRSLPYATLAWTKVGFGLDLINFRLGNLLLHAAVVLAVFLFLGCLFTTVYGGHESKGLSPRLAAFFAALLFALHPVATYAVGYLVQRTIVMATLFSLLAMLAYVQGSVRQKTLLLWLSVPLYYLAALSKEHAIMLPAVLLVLTLLLHKDWQTQLKQRAGLFVALGGIVVFVALARKGLIGSVYEGVAPDLLQDVKLAYPLSVVTQCWLFFKYALLWIFPNPGWMSIDIREPFALSLWSSYLVAVGCYLAWGVGACWLLLKRGMTGLTGLAMLFPWLMFLTEFSSVRIQEVFVLYRSYLWAVGAFCLLPVLFARINARLASFILALVALAMFLVSMERLVIMSQPLFLWDDAEKLVKGRTDLPGAYRIYYNRGTERAGLGLLDPAIADYKQAIVLNPNFSESYSNLGAAYAQQDDFDHAIQSFQMAIEVARRGDKTYAQAQGNLGTAYFKKGDWKNSVAAFNQAIEITQSEGKPLTPRDIHGRAQAFEKIGELHKAQADYKESCRLAKRGCEKLIEERIK